MSVGDNVNKSQLAELKQYLEQPYEVLSMDGLQPLVVVPDCPENIDYEQVAALPEESSTAGSHSSLSPAPTGVQQDLRGATIDKLVEKLTHHEQSVIFQQIFFLTYRSFSSPSELLKKLVQRFIQLKQLEQAQIAESAHANRMLLRLWGSLKRWLDEHYYDFDNELVSSYVNFLNEYAVENLNLALQLKKKLESNLLYDKQQQSMAENLTAASTKPNIPKPVLRKLLGKPEEVDITEIDAMEIAKQITLIEHDIFRNIRPKECFKNAWNKKEKEKLAPNIVAIINRFNAVSTWTATLILQGQDAKRRAKLIGHFIKIAKNCKEMNNLNAMNSIVSALNNAAVHRLAKSWALLSKQRQETFQQLCALVSMEGAYKNMREHLRSIAPPLVPYIGIYLTDLTFMEDGNPDFVKPKNSGGSTPTELKLINFTKRRKIARIIMDIRTLQGAMYNFPQVHALHKYLMKCEPRWGDSQLFNQSLKVEPREAR